jgi:hypothetical protein
VQKFDALLGRKVINIAKSAGKTEGATSELKMIWGRMKVDHMEEVRKNLHIMGRYRRQFPSASLL